MSTNQNPLIVDALRIAPKYFSAMTYTKSLYLVVEFDPESNELKDAVIQRNDPLVADTTAKPFSPQTKGKVERFFRKFETAFLEHHREISFGPFSDAAAKWIDTLRNAEGRVFL